MHWSVREVVGRLVRRVARARLGRFGAATARCRETQHRVLLRKLARNARSAFGRAHGFARVRSPADFRRQLPVAGYDYYAPYIDRVKRGETDAMFGPGTRVLMFALTSGTTSEPKYIPVTRDFLDEYRAGWMLWGIRTFDAHPELYRLKVMQLASDWDVSRTPCGIPCGSVSGLTAKVQKRVVRERYCVPPCLVRTADITAKYYAALRLSVPLPVGMAMAANPSTLVGLAKLGDREKEALVRDLADGTLDAKFDIPSDVRRELAPLTRQRHTRRARELELIIHQTGHLYPKHYWPTLKLLSNWTGGSMGAYLRQYAGYWGSTPVRDIGLIASEGRMTIPLEDGTAAGVLDIAHHYFEFIPEREIDSDHPTVLEAHELQEGAQYYILLTTSSGLYRYDIHDVVRCVGFYNRAPLLEFLNKGSQYSSITGEKLTEFQVSRAVEKSLPELNLVLSAFTLAPCWGDPPYYALLVEAGDLPNPHGAAQLPERVDHHLMCQNLEYETKRATQRIGALRLKVVPPGTWERFTRVRLAETGGTAEQYKHPCLVPDLDFVGRFSIIQEIVADSPRPGLKFA